MFKMNLSVDCCNSLVNSKEIINRNINGKTYYLCKKHESSFFYKINKNNSDLPIQYQKR
jgi:hypothetical protein